MWDSDSTKYSLVAIAQRKSEKSCILIYQHKIWNKSYFCPLDHFKIWRYLENLNLQNTKESFYKEPEV